MSQGLRDQFWFQAMQASLKAEVDCIKAFSETDFTDDLKKFDRPTLVIHGDEDPMIPVAAFHAAKAALVRNGFAVEDHVSPGLGHSIDLAGLQLGGRFLARVLG